MSTSVKLQEYDIDEPEVDRPFREVVGSPMWLAEQTRPDVSNVTRVVLIVRFSHAPKYVHWMAALSVSEYLKGTSGFGITFQQGNGVELEDFAHVGNVSKTIDRRSVSSEVTMCGGSCKLIFKNPKMFGTFHNGSRIYLCCSV